MGKDQVANAPAIIQLETRKPFLLVSILLSAVWVFSYRVLKDPDGCSKSSFRKILLRMEKAAVSLFKYIL